MPYHRTLAFTFLATLALLALVVLAFGATAPEFPFKNFQQVGAEIPGLTLRSTEMESCATYQMGAFVYKETGGDGLWIIWASGTHLTAGILLHPAEMLMGGPSEGWLYYGEITPGTQAITIQRVVSFDEGKRETPCARWKEPA